MNVKISKLLIVIALLLCAHFVFAADSMEFDGAYIKMCNGDYIELQEKTVHSAKIIVEKQVPENAPLYAVIESSMFSQAFNTPKQYYVADKAGMISIPANEFKGIAIKGQYNFKSFTLHPLVERRLKSNEVFYENSGPARKSRPFYIPGKMLNVRGKSLGSDAYYFQPRGNLARGEYVAWIGDSFWLFKIK